MRLYEKELDRDLDWALHGIPVIRLPELLELKLASGISSPGRLKDLADVQELIRALNLPADFAIGLNPYVRDKYSELWSGVHQDQPDDPTR